MKIAVFGAGNVGGALGKRLAALGHDIYFGVKEPQSDKIKRLLAETPGARGGSVEEAASEAEIVILATPFDVTEKVLSEAGDLSGKIVIDCTIPLKASADGLALSVGFTTSGAEMVAGWVPGAKVCKAFNQTGSNNMEDTQYSGGHPVMFVCGDDPESNEVVRRLSQSLGFESIDAGRLQIARLLEPLAMLWIHLAFNSDLKRDFAFAVLRR
jgi:8-hydroxy-5-deazaflavin:NADPH oxidoreductase